MSFFVKIYHQFEKNFSHSRGYNIRKEKLMGTGTSRTCHHE